MPPVIRNGRPQEHGVHVRFFVVRVLLHMPGPRARPRPVTFADMDTPTRLTVLALVQAGNLVTLPDGCICEGVKEFSNELDAHAHREELARTYPEEDFRVIITSAEPVA